MLVKKIFSIVISASLLLVPITGLSKNTQYLSESNKINSVSNFSFEKMSYMIPAEFKVFNKKINKSVQFYKSDSKYSFNFEGKPMSKGSMDPSKLNDVKIDLIETEDSTFTLKLNLEKLPKSKFPEVLMSWTFQGIKNGENLYQAKVSLPDGKVLEEMEISVPKTDSDEATLSDFYFPNYLPKSQKIFRQANFLNSSSEFGLLRNLKNSVNFATPVIIIPIAVVIVAALGCAALMGWCNMSCYSLCGGRGGKIKSVETEYCINCRCECEYPQTIQKAATVNEFGIEEFGW